MASVAGATDMGLSIGKLVARGNSAERRAAKSEFSGLVHRVRQANLLDHRPRAYAVKAVLIIVGIAATAAAVIVLNHTWWAVLLAPVAAVLSAQTAFFGHDAGHKQISASAKVDRRLGLVAANLLNGISYGWWQDKHLRHHAHPNEVGLDPDVGEGVIAWTERQAAEKKGWSAGSRGTKPSYSFPC
jgi:fatty acid desaturase